MAINTGRLGTVTFAQESSWGTKATTDKRVSFTGESLSLKLDKKEDGRNVGEVALTDLVTTGKQVDGGIDATLHTDEAGWLAYFALGKSDTPNPAPVAKIFVYYNGSNAYASLTNSSGTITGKSGADAGGAGTDFTLDTSNASYDTVSELTAAIEAITDWNADYVGLDSADTATIADFAETEIDGSYWLKVRGNGLVIQYTGSNAYAQVRKSGDDLILESGANVGSVSADLTLDTSQAANDTLTELQVLIDADPDYTCSLVGEGSTDSGFIGDFTGRSCKAASIFVGATDAWEHKIYLGTATDTEPSFTFLENKTLGTNESLAQVGAKCNSLAMNFNNREIITASLDIIAKDEDPSEVDVSPTIIEHTPYTGNVTRVWEGGYESQKSKSLTITVNNNLDVSGLLGTDYIDEPIRTNVAIEVSSSENLDSTVYLRNKANYTSSTPIEFLVNSQGVDYADSNSSTLYDITIRIRKMELSTYEANMGDPGRIVTELSGQAIKSANYSHIEMYVIDQRSSAYSA